MKTIFFEDQLTKRFHPLTLTRPVDDLRIGIFTISQKWQQALGLHVGKPVMRILRQALNGVFNANNVQEGEEVLFINSRFMPSDDLLDNIAQLKPKQLISCKCDEGNEHFIAFKWIADEGSMLQELPNLNNFEKLFIQQTNQILRIWDIFLKNSAEIEADIKRSSLNGIHESAKVSPYAIIEGKERVVIEEGAVIEAGAILLAEDGPIYIGKNATIMAGAILRSHVAVCEKAQVKMAAKIYENTTIGPVCKVGGEVSSTVFHSYSNKGHDGFVGNSIIGQWCNFGADSNTSNLKNNYGAVRFADWETKKLIDSGRQFLGTIMGDHSKTAINTMLNTGTICGVSCNLFSSSFPHKYVPSFRWLADDSTRLFEFNKAMEVAERVMSRRSIELTQDYINMMKIIFNNASLE